MSRMSMFLSSLAVLAIAVSLSGCGGASDSTPAEGQPEATGGDKHAGHKHGEEGSGHMMPASTEVEKALAELSPEDRTAAEKQRICPVTDLPLGSMGKPTKITVKNREVFLCCAMCNDAITEEPDKYLAKIPQ